MILQAKFFESVDGIPFGASRSQVRAHFGSFKSVPEIGTPGSPRMERDLFHPTAAVTYIDDGFAFFHTLDAELVVDGRNLNRVPYEITTVGTKLNVLVTKS